MSAASFEHKTIHPSDTIENSIALVVTGRADFRVVDDNLQLIDIAPGIHMERHIYSHTAFRPSMATDLRLMDARLFRQERMNLINDIEANR